MGLGLRVWGSLSSSITSRVGLDHVALKLALLTPPSGRQCTGLRRQPPNNPNLKLLINQVGSRARARMEFRPGFGIYSHKPEKTQLYARLHVSSFSPKLQGCNFLSSPSIPRPCALSFLSRPLDGSLTIELVRTRCKTCPTTQARGNQPRSQTKATSPTADTRHAMATR